MNSFAWYTDILVSLWVWKNCARLSPHTIFFKTHSLTNISVYHAQSIQFDIITNAFNNFLRKIWFCNVQTTCPNIYIMHKVTVLRNFYTAAFRKCVKTEKLKIWWFWLPKKNVIVHKNAYLILSITNAFNNFFRKIWLCNVQMTCPNLYWMHEVTALRNLYTAAFHKCLKYEKFKIQIIFDCQKLLFA